MKFNDEEYKKIAARIKDGYEADKDDQAEWLKRNEAALEIANQCRKEKTFPWRGASNVKLPMMIKASIDFATRAYPEILPDAGVVKARVINENPEKAARAKRVTDYMSYQLLEKEENWEPDTDQLLHILPVVGQMYRKRYYDFARQKCASELVMPDKMTVSKDSRRYTHKIDNMCYSDIKAKQNSGQWRDDVDLLKGQEMKKLDELPKFDVLEQHCWMDLDGDGYEEPYVIVVCEEEVMDIEPRYQQKDITRNSDGEVINIEPEEFITDYKFIPDITGGQYGLGFGQLLLGLSESSNAIINQLVDAGTLKNAGGGFLDERIKILSGKHEMRVGEWKRVSCTNVSARIADGIVPTPVSEPSPTLFQLLGLIIDMARDLGSVKDVLNGDIPASNMPASTMAALVEQGMKTFSAIYKRIYRSLKKEIKILYRLNGKHLNEQEYFDYNDEVSPVLKQDFTQRGLDIIPQANPNLASDTQRITKAEALRQLIGVQGVNQRPILINYLEALKVEPGLIEQILPEPQPAPPSPEMLAMQQELEIKKAEMDIKQQELELKERELGLKSAETNAKITETQTKAIKNLAEASSKDATADAALLNAEANYEKMRGENEKRMVEARSDTSSDRSNSPNGRPTI